METIGILPPAAYVTFIEPPYAGIFLAILCLPNRIGNPH